MTIRFRPCNLCGEKVSIHPLYKRFGYQIVRCSTCSLVYLANIPPAHQLAGLYSKRFFQASSKFKPAPNNPSLINARSRVQQALNLRGVKTSAWLDVGCATGDFVLAARSHVRQAHGSDVSPYAIHIARNRGLNNLKTGDFVSLKYPSSTFDLISMWDLIEHVSNPKAAFAKAYASLASGGYLVLSTGDVGSWSSRVSGRFWHLMIPPMHIYFFSRRTIRRYLKESGFTHIKITYQAKIVPLDFLIEKALRLINPAFSGKISPALTRLKLDRIRFSLNLHDIMTVSARKSTKKGGGS